MHKLSEIAHAVDIPARTVAAWLDRKLINVPTSGSGNYRSFSKRDIERIAVVADLVKVGLPVADAARAAAVFADQGQPDRAAGELFAEGKTFLLIDGDGTSVVNAHDRDEFENAMALLFECVRTAIVLNVGTVLARVDRALSGSSKPLPPAGAVYRHGRQLMT